MNPDELASDIRLAEERLAAMRLRTKHDWSALGTAVARKKSQAVSWAPWAIGALGLGMLLITVARRKSRPAYVPHRVLGPALRPSAARWASVLGAAGAVARVVMLPQTQALWRTLRKRAR